MANVLNMEKRILIQQLRALGWSYRQIEQKTGIRRETVAKYDPHRTAKAAKVPTVSESLSENRPKCPPTSAALASENFTQDSPALPASSRSRAHAHDALLRAKLAQNLSAQRIYQDLRTDHGYTGSYDSIKRYLRQLKQKTPQVVARLHAPPGEEAQVDFGQGAPTLKQGRYVRPWLFKMVLSYSRHSYEEVVWRQDVETFIRCHERAFENFGGVPKLIRLDNLKAGVLRAHVYEPELHPVYAAFAQHAGFAPLPCLPRKPEHKGKVESGIGYTQANALKGCKFESLAEQNAHLKRWNQRWARTRIHGTTKLQVGTLFCEHERPRLLPVPQTPFSYFNVGARTVQRDGHVEVERAYYSVPHRYLGQRVTVHHNAAWVKVFAGAAIIATHRKTSPGRFQTTKTHLPENKTLALEEYQARLRARCLSIGTHCQQWASRALEARQQLAFRAIQGVLRLAQKYSFAKIDTACEQALLLGSLRYHTVALLCQEQAETSRTQLELLQEHEMLRPLTEYQNYLAQLTP